MILGKFKTTLTLIAMLAGANPLWCGPTIDLDTAIESAMEYSLPLKIAQLEFEVKEGEECQAAAYPNPILSVELDDFGGNGSDRYWDESSEFSFTVSQLILLGGKHRAAKKTARMNTCAASWDYEIQKADLLMQLHCSFIGAAEIQEKLKLTEKLQEAAEKVAIAVKIKRENGRATLIEQKKVEIAARTGKIAADKIRRDFDNAKRALSMLWGCSIPDFETVSFPLFSLEPPQSLESLLPLLNETPEMEKMIAEWNASRAATSLERAKRIPDLEVTAGVSTWRNCRDYSFNLEFTIPLPFFDTNQGNIQAATAAEWQRYYAYQGLLDTLATKLSEVHQNWSRAYAAASELKHLIDSEAKETIEAAAQGYQQGKYEYLDFIDAQRTVYDIHSNYIEAAAECHRKKAEAQRITAQLATDTE